MSTMQLARAVAAICLFGLPLSAASACSSTDVGCESHVEESALLQVQGASSLRQACDIPTVGGSNYTFQWHFFWRAGARHAIGDALGEVASEGPLEVEFLDQVNTDNRPDAFGKFVKAKTLGMFFLCEFLSATGLKCRSSSDGLMVVDLAITETKGCKVTQMSMPGAYGSHRVHGSSGRRVLISYSDALSHKKGDVAQSTKLLEKPPAKPGCGEKYPTLLGAKYTWRVHYYRVQGTERQDEPTVEVVEKTAFFFKQANEKNEPDRHGIFAGLSVGGQQFMCMYGSLDGLFCTSSADGKATLRLEVDMDSVHERTCIPRTINIPFAWGSDMEPFPAKRVFVLQGSLKTSRWFQAAQSSPAAKGKKSKCGEVPRIQPNSSFEVMVDAFSRGPCDLLSQTTGSGPHTEQQQFIEQVDKTGKPSGSGKFVMVKPPGELYQLCVFGNAKTLFCTDSFSGGTHTKLDVPADETTCEPAHLKVLHSSGPKPLISKGSQEVYVAMKA